MEILEVFGLFYKRAGFYLKVFVYGGGVVWKDIKEGVLFERNTKVEGLFTE